MVLKELIMERICETFLGLGFVEMKPGILPNSSPSVQENEKIFCMNNHYCRPQYLSSMGFLIEYAHTVKTFPLTFMSTVDFCVTLTDEIS